MTYSRNDTAEALRHALNGTGKLDSLPTLIDVDTIADLPFLHEALQRVDNPTATQIELVGWLTNMNSISTADTNRI